MLHLLVRMGAFTEVLAYYHDHSDYDCDLNY